VCGGPLTERKMELVCAQCHTVCETCCEGGRVGEPESESEAAPPAAPAAPRAPAGVQRAEPPGRAENRRS
jgi:hypothetical protein